MVEIIERGTKRKLKCPECGTVFRYDSKYDVTKDGNNYYIPCPVCKEKVYIKQSR